MKVPGPGFLDRLWGKKARVLQKTIALLRTQHWAMINDHVSVHFTDLTQPENGMVDDKDDASYPHACLIIDW